MRIALFAAALLASTGAQAQSPVEPTVAAVAMPDLPKGKLTDAVRPSAYRLDLTVDPAQPRFSGKVEIDAVLAAPSRTVVLHGNGLVMRRTTVRFGKRELAGEWRQVDPTGVAMLTFPEPLPPGPLTFAFDYDAKFSDQPAGMFRVKVGEDWYSWTQFESIDARAAFPSFDQPSFKTPFTVTLRTPPGLMAVSNAPELAKASESGLDVHRFKPTLPLPTYLVAMMVGPFASVAGEVAPTPQRSAPLPLRVVSTRPNADKLTFALAGSQDIVRLLEDFFGDGFPYPKLDQITSPIMPGAMENAGADLYADALIVMDERAPIPQRRKFGMVVAHELAHQWFGDLVTPAWWDDIWLNESFANWMGYHIGDAWRPELNIRTGALAEGFAAMDTDALVAGRPIRQKIETNGQIDAAFDSITYGKGGQVVAMIADFMGAEKFRDGVRSYMASHRYGNATSADFFAALATAAGDPRIVPAMRSFTDQQGVPLLTFRREAAGYTVTQSRYAPLGASPPPGRWGVPMCLRQATERRCQLLTEDSAAVGLNAGSGPLIPNAGGTGYYRFELPREDWDSLIAASASLTGGEAQAAADSLAASILAGRADVAQLATLARVLAHHTDSYASDAASMALADLVSSGVVDTKARRGWRAFRGKLYAPLLETYGFDPRAGVYSGEEAERTQRRAQIVARVAGSNRDGKLRRQLVKAADAYLKGDAGVLDSAWFERAFGFYVSRGGGASAKALVERALASEDPVFRPAALSAAATSGNKSVATWLLSELADPRLRASEKRRLLADIMVMRATRDIGYQYLRANIDTLTAAGGIFVAVRLPRMLGTFCSVEDADEVARFFGPRFAGKPGELELARAIERVRNCAALRGAKGAEISAALAALK